MKRRKMKFSLSVIAVVLAMTMLSSFVPPAAKTEDFADIPSTEWYYDEVSYVIEAGLMNGMSKTEFSPDSSMTRAQLVTVLWRLDGKRYASGEYFDDVPFGEWYEYAVNWAAENGIVNGVGNGKFDPDGNVTREQIATIFRRFSKYTGTGISVRGADISAYPDYSSVSEYALDAMSWANGAGLILGDEKEGVGYLDPGASATRAQVATILCRYMSTVMEDTSANMDSSFIASQMRLSVDLFKASVLESQNENVLVSPLSVQLALAMIANGAAGETRDEMEALLGGGASLEELNEYLFSYVKSLPSDEKYKLGIANSIWFRDKEDFRINEEFLSTNEDYYGADMYKKPFDDSTLNEINAWVDEHTDGMIEKIIDRMDPDSLMYLINAVVFDAEWADIYDEDHVSEGLFTSLSGAKRSVEMMSSKEHKYLDDGNATGFVKNYNGGKYGFAVLLPNKGVDLYEYVSGLTGGDMLETLSGASKCKVVAQMPKFSSDYSINMDEFLPESSMPTAFNPTLADFSGITDSVPLYISKVIHKTHIEVGERGTRAGAVTAVPLAPGASPNPEDIKYVTLDRPFVYMIIDNATNLPVFIGTTIDIQG